MTEAQFVAACEKYGIGVQGSGDDARYNYDGGSWLPAKSVFGFGWQVPRPYRKRLAYLLQRQERARAEVAGRADDFSRGARVAFHASGARQWAHGVVLSVEVDAHSEEGWRIVKLIYDDGRRTSKSLGASGVSRELRKHDSKEHGRWRGPVSVLDALQRSRARAMAVVEKIDAEIAAEGGLPSQNG